MMTTGNVSAAAMTFYKKRSQSFLRKKLYVQKLGTQEEIDRYSGQVLSTWRPIPVAAQTTALTEGTAPADIAITTSTYTATLQQWGAYVKISDLLEVTGRSSMMDVATKVLGYKPVSSIRAEVAHLRKVLDAGGFKDIDASEHYNMKFMKVGRNAGSYEFLSR